MSAKHIIIGRFGAPFGVQGWVKVQSFTDPISSILDYKPWLIEKSGQWQPVKITASKIRTQDILVKPADCENPETARLYTQQYIQIERAQLPAAAPGEYYWADLIGLTVINQAQQTLGKVLELRETGANQVLIVQDRQKQHWLPLIPQVILKIDLQAGKILVDWDKDF